MSTTTRERPILFSAPMVRAILAGRKTQTRRVCTFLDARYGWTKEELADHRHVWECHRDDGSPQWQDHDDIIPNHYGVPGDRLWVKETIVRRGPWKDGCDSADFADDGAQTKLDAWPWRGDTLSPIFMPRWLSRIDLEVTAIRVERLHAIVPTDIRAEGIDVAPCGCEACGMTSILCPATVTTYYELWQEGWDAINGKRAPWSSNPWVWVVEFKRVRP